MYDVESRRTTLRVKAHTEDVNAVAFADTASSNILLSGSDDCLLKVWDIRSLKNGRPSGTLAGHTEGITYLAPKGDGRYCISNGKDQTLRLFDLRTISDAMDEKIRVDRKDYGISGWGALARSISSSSQFAHDSTDYRNTSYAKHRFVDHPYDMSVNSYRLAVRRRTDGFLVQVGDEISRSRCSTDAHSMRLEPCRDDESAVSVLWIKRWTNPCQSFSHCLQPDDGQSHSDTDATRIDLVTRWNGRTGARSKIHSSPHQRCWTVQRSCFALPSINRSTSERILHLYD